MTTAFSWAILTGFLLAGHAPSAIARTLAQPPAKEPVPAAEAPASPTPSAPADSQSPEEALARAKTLMVGDPAPPLSIGAWLKGDPLPTLAPDVVYVVEFWATWCGPCRRSMTLLSKLQSKSEPSKLAVIGLCGADAQGESLERIKTFLGKREREIAYRIAFDSEAATRAAWLGAARITQIPAAFVVAKDGRIAWIGNPATAGPALERAVAQLLDGSFDFTKAVAAAQLEQARRAEIEAEGVALQAKLREAMQSNDPDGVISYADALVRLDNDRYARLAVVKFETLLREKRQPSTAYAYAAELLNDRLRDDPVALASVAYAILEAPQGIVRNLELALALAKRANEVAGDEDPTVLDTLARAYFETGDPNLAAATQQKAIAKAPEGQMADKMRQTLELYSASKK